MKSASSGESVTLRCWGLRSLILADDKFRQPKILVVREVLIAGGSDVNMLKILMKRFEKVTAAESCDE